MLGLNRSIGGAIGAIALVSLLSSGLFLAALHQVDRTTARQARSTRILSELDAFRSAMLNQETGLRGYLLTGNPESLKPYRDGAPELDGAIARLRALLGANMIESARLSEAEEAARRWQSDVGEPAVRDMADPATRDEARARETRGDGMRLFDQVRDKLDAIRGEEEATLSAQTVVVAQAERGAIVALGVGTLLTLLICGAIGIAINRLIVVPLIGLAAVMRRLSHRDLSVAVPAIGQRNEVGDMARAVDVFKQNLIEFDRTSLLRATADTLPAMLGYIDGERRIGFLNDEFLHWFDLGAQDVAEVYGHPLKEVFAPIPFPGAARELEAALAGVETRFEHRLGRRGGGGGRDLEAIYRPYRAVDGTVLGVVTLLTDITDRKTMERRLARQTRDLVRSNEELEQFAYVASHDLKAPLRGIENLVSWIEEDLEGVLTGDTQANMTLLKSRVRRLENLLDDLLAYSRAGRATEENDLVDTRALVEDLATLLAPPEGFIVAADASLPTVTAPRAPLTQIFQNLIGNAVKHHDRPAEGHVRVDAQARPEGVEFRVTDDGAGIPEKFHDRVFGMFQTLRPRDEVEGSGMGLAVVKKLVERRGGKIWLTGGRDDRGLSVHFLWPATPAGGSDGANG
jgi:PAS domain S-box-containing protein